MSGLTARALSPVSVQVDWDVSDMNPGLFFDSLVISQSPAQGPYPSQSLSTSSGTTPFVSLSPATSYDYTLVPTFSDPASGSRIVGTTLHASATTPVTGSGGGGGGTKRSLDELLALARAVNETTLGRMEAELSGVRTVLVAMNSTTLLRIESELKAIAWLVTEPDWDHLRGLPPAVVASFNRIETEIVRVRSLLDAVNTVTLARMESAIKAIEAKV